MKHKRLFVGKSKQHWAFVEVNFDTFSHVSKILELFQVWVALLNSDIFSVCYSSTKGNFQKPSANWVTNQKTLAHEKLVRKNKNQKWWSLLNHGCNIKIHHSFYKIRSFILKYFSPNATPIMSNHSNFLRNRVFLNDWRNHHSAYIFKRWPPRRWICFRTKVWHCENNAPVVFLEKGNLVIPKSCVIWPTMDKEKFIFWLVGVTMDFNLDSFIFGLRLWRKHFEWQVQHADNKHNWKQNDLQNDETKQGSKDVTRNLKDMRHF